MAENISPKIANEIDDNNLSRSDYGDQSAKQAVDAQRSSARNKKASAAFRTISEVADELGVQQHVLRFWETKFSHVKPLKRGGGRRYYRPEDVDLLKAIHRLLYTEGYTIKGVQKLMRDVGKKQVVISFGGDEPEVGAFVRADALQDAPETDAVKTAVSGKEQPHLSAEQKAVLQSVLDELKELRGMVRKKR